MDQYQPEQDPEAVNAQMVRQMELRRQARPERRQRSAPRSNAVVAHERRRVCGFCHQPGDHATPTQCLRALERP
jgi:hypothetical protein